MVKLMEYDLWHHGQLVLLTLHQTLEGRQLPWLPACLA